MIITPLVSQVLPQLQTTQESNKTQQETISKLHSQFESTRHQMAQLYEDFEKAREKWRVEKNELETKAERLEEATSSAKAKASEYEDHMKAINNGSFLRYFQIFECISTKMNLSTR